MKRTILKWAGIALLAIMAAQITSCKKKEVFDGELKKSFEMTSQFSGATYKISVGLPANYNQNNKYATLYVLDGENDFDFVANECKKIADEKKTNNVIVVGIGYGNDRTLDYTPTKANEGGGGAQQFMEFIKNELAPKMQQDFAADTCRSGRVILGHSFGGLFAAYAYTKYNEVFGAYLMLSPSVWYDNEVLLGYEQETRLENENRNQVVFMGLGELENAGRMRVPFEAFYQRLKENYPGIKLQRNIEPNLDHVGSKKPNITSALNFYFANR